MWTYILRRLLLIIPTLFGVTVIAFLVMQMAPGDPLASSLGSSGMSQQSDQTRDAYLIRKRDYKLDKPLFLNFNYFRDYSDRVALVTDYLGVSEEQIAAELATFIEPIDPTSQPTKDKLVDEEPAENESENESENEDENESENESENKSDNESDAEPEPTHRIRDLSDQPDLTARLELFQSFDINDFDKSLADPQQHPRLATAIQGFCTIACEDLGQHGVEPSIEILRSKDANARQKLGAIRGLNSMVIDPFAYTYSRKPSDKETPRVVATWKTWWKDAEKDFPKLDSKRRVAVEKRYAALLKAESKTELFDGLSYFDTKTSEPFSKPDMRPFLEKLLADDSTLDEKVIGSLALRLYLGKPLTLSVALPPTKPEEEPTDKPTEEQPTEEQPTEEQPTEVQETSPEKKFEEQLADHHKQVDEVAANWLVHFEQKQDEYETPFFTKVGRIFSDTQYATAFWRLVTFQFGRSTLKTREPVGTKILDAVLVSAPLMLLSQLVIYLVAVPAGIVCAVNRNNWKDRTISLVLFLLFSIPPFVAGMLFLLWFSFNANVFPMNGLHADAADSYGFFAYVIDYLWHIILPVVCLSLFSLAAMAMYARTSMLDVIGQDYVRTARAKGVSEDKVIFKHALRNALIPIVTLFSSFLPAMLGGSVLIEYIFGIPGMGRLSWQSILLLDFPTMMALLYINAILVMLSILFTDILYVVIDPRIGFSKQGSGA